MAPLRICIGDRALVALSLDDTVMQSELRVRVTYGANNRNVVEGEPDDLRIVVNDIIDRANPAEGFEHIASDRAALRRARRSVDRQLEQQGYRIVERFGRTCLLEPIFPSKTTTESK